MTKSFKQELETNPISVERRQFFRVASTSGFTVAALAATGGALFSSEAVAQINKEEEQRQKAAKFTMTIATEYKIGISRGYPIMQLDLKENIQNATRGQVYVRLAPASQLGTGSVLVKKVQEGTIQAAQHSLSNFAPFAPIVDLINLPYFCGSNQKFVNLVNSDPWKKIVHPQIEAKGFKPLFYIVIDPRTVAMRKGEKAVFLPEDLKGVKFRVPGSKILQNYYRIIGANPTPIAWGETTSAIKQGVADALDPAAGALYAFGFKDILSNITFTRFVPDSQIYSCNLEWFKSLPKDVQEGIDFASEITAHQNLAKVPSARGYAMSELGDAGVKFHSLSNDQLAAWEKAGGYKRDDWTTFRNELATPEVLSQLEQAVNTQSKLYVHDV